VGGGGRRLEDRPRLPLTPATHVEVSRKQWDSWDFAFAGRDELEDPLHQALTGRIGQVGGGGSGMGKCDIDMEVTDLASVLHQLRDLRQVRLSATSYRALEQPPAHLHIAEWGGARGVTPCRPVVPSNMPEPQFVPLPRPSSTIVARSTAKE
jgi:hypothetical protein